MFLFMIPEYAQLTDLLLNLPSRAVDANLSLAEMDRTCLCSEDRTDCSKLDLVMIFMRACSLRMYVLSIRCY